jgi:hypothetical protein
MTSVSDYSRCSIDSRCDYACSTNLTTLITATGSVDASDADTICALQAETTCLQATCCSNCSNIMSQFVQCMKGTNHVCPEIQCSDIQGNRSSGDIANNLSQSSCTMTMMGYFDCLEEKKCEDACDVAMDASPVFAENGPDIVPETDEEVCPFQNEFMCPLITCCRDCQTHILDYYECIVTANTEAKRCDITCDGNNIKTNNNNDNQNSISQPTTSTNGVGSGPTSHTFRMDINLVHVSLVSLLLWFTLVSTIH